MAWNFTICRGPLLEARRAGLVAILEPAFIAVDFRVCGGEGAVMYMPMVVMSLGREGAAEFSGDAHEQAARSDDGALRDQRSGGDDRALAPTA